VRQQGFTSGSIGSPHVLQHLASSSGGTAAGALGAAACAMATVMKTAKNRVDSTFIGDLLAPRLVERHQAHRFA
jgi:hypothetical protein